MKIADVAWKSMTNMIQIWQQIWQIWTTNMTENTKKSPKITKITTNHHQHPPTNQYVKVTDQSNIAMFWVKKLISQPTVPAEPPFFEQIILTH